MKKLKNFIKTTMLGGVIVVLPIVLTVFLIRWIFNLVLGLIEPLTRIITEQANTQRIVAVVSALIIITVVCFLIGLTVKTRAGGFLYKKFERYILKVAPGYSLFKETFKQLVGKENRPFSSVVLANVFGTDTQMTGFITDEHPDGKYTVFFPSALNPTTGLLCHLDPDKVQKVNVSVETAMRTIISCGVGSAKLFEKQAKILD